MITEITAVRHGETDDNLNKRLQGQTDTPLNENGRMQAAAVGKALEKETFDVIYSSDLLRAAESAEMIAACGHRGVPLVFTEKLREWDCGDYQGVCWKDIPEKYSKAFAFERGGIRFPNGESREEFQERISLFLDDIIRKHQGEKILLIAHGGVLQRIFRKVCGIVDENNLIPLAGNASITSFQYNSDVQGWQMTSWNRREHLQGLREHITPVL